ncbi:hypothetical protein D3C78_1151860 [compost metagenome]
MRQRSGRHAGEQRHEAAEQQRAGYQVGQHHRVPQAQALHQRYREQAGQGRGAGGQENRQEHQGRVGRPLLRAVHEDGHRQQGQRRGIQHQEENLRVARRVLARVELLKRLHRLEADGGGGVVQAQAVGGEVEGDQADGRVTGRYFRHQPAEQRPQQPRQRIHQAGLLGDAQEAEPERQGAEQQDHHFDRQLGHGEQAFHHGGEHRRLAADQPARQRRHCGDHEEAQPQAVEHDSFPPCEWPG